MKEHFTQIEVAGLVPPSEEEHTVRCTRCGEEYPSVQLVYGYRGDDQGSLCLYCATSNCYGRYPSDIYPIEITN